MTVHTVDRQVFVQAVESCVGTPVRHMGRLIGGGLDCVGVPLCAAAMCGLHIDAPATYSNPPGAGALFDTLERECERVAREESADGDLLVTVWKGEPRHLMVRVGSDKHGRIIVVHARGASGKVVKQTILGTSVHSCWRLRGVG